MSNYKDSINLLKQTITPQDNISVLGISFLERTMEDID